MAKAKVPILAFNRGRISPLALARIDLERTALSAEIQTNLIPRTLGSAQARPGMEFTGSRKGNNQSISIPFIFANDDLAEIELTNIVMRIWVDDALITRPSVSASVTNGLFTSNLTSWNDTDESGAASTFVTGGFMGLLGTGTNAAQRNQTITVTETSTVHALRVIIERGPVTLRVGTTAGDDTYIAAVLKTGTHSLAFTPTGNFVIEFSSVRSYTVLVDSVVVESAGDLELPTPWLTADLPNIRHDQSADVVFLADGTFQQRRIERRANDSWSVVLYEPEDGPFGLLNVSPLTIAASAISGDITLTTSKAFWKSTMVGELYKLTSEGQTVQASVVAEDNFTSSIKITGVGSAREFSISVAGTWVATVTLQRGTDDITFGEDVSTFTSNTTTTLIDGLDNITSFYRIGVKTSEFTSGSVELTLSFTGGSLTGIARVTSLTSTTIVNAVVLVALGSTDATDDWFRSQWSTLQGFPSAIAFYEGRLFYSGKGGIWGSVSDGFESFDTEVVGDSGPINRTFGSGPVDIINWLLPAQRLLIGTATSEMSARSTSFDEPLTPANFNIKTSDDQGSSRINPVRDGQRALFVQRSGNKLYQLVLTLEDNDYSAVDLSELIPEIGQPFITRIAIQRQPDTRIHCVKSDGSVAVLVKDDAERTLAWIDVTVGQTSAGDGNVEDVYVLPAQVGESEDTVYYTVKRTINSVTTRTREKWAFEANAVGGTTNKMPDSFQFETGVSKTVITGLTHLEGETVVLWGNGKFLSDTLVVSGGSITAPETVTSYCVGLNWTWQYKSTKLAYASDSGLALNQGKHVDQLGIIAKDFHPKGLQYGSSFAADDLFDMPKIENAQTVDPDTVRDVYDEETIPFPGLWDTDSRIFLQGSSRYPCTLLAFVFGLQTNDKD